MDVSAARFAAGRTGPGQGEEDQRPHHVRKRCCTALTAGRCNPGVRTLCGATGRRGGRLHLVRGGESWTDDVHHIQCAAGISGKGAGNRAAPLPGNLPYPEMDGGKVGRGFGRFSGAVFPGSFEVGADGVLPALPIAGRVEPGARHGPAGLEWLRDAGLSRGLITKRYAFEDCVDMRVAESWSDAPSL